MKKILVACGTGMATSTMIAQKISHFLTENHIQVSTQQCSLNEIPLNKQGVDLIVTSMKTNADYGIPTLNGAPFLTGINDGTIKQQLLELLK
ncbi:PTS sugar transporter subunit IIB [Enterobacter sp.]|jgi:PTS system galactitol-specific IIB component|uniref:PTS sugar transporter subunit IIB n=1 Tax=Enterobacter sp. TaxID=42895 RepID=UPI00296E4ECA|nr:PTS sugar transporter subunit IIB [Enterobacter sp.]